MVDKLELKVGIDIEDVRRKLKTLKGDMSGAAAGAVGTQATKGGGGGGGGGIAGLLGAAKAGVAGIAAAIGIGVLSQASKLFDNTINRLIKVLMMLLRPIGDILALALRPLVIILRPIAQILNAMWRPIRQQVMKLQSAGSTLVRQGMKTGNMQMVGEGVAALTASFALLMKPNIDILLNVGKVISQAVVGAIFDLGQMLGDVFFNSIKSVIMVVEQLVLAFFDLIFGLPGVSDALKLLGVDTNTLRENIKGGFEGAITTVGNWQKTFDAAVQSWKTQTVQKVGQLFQDLQDGWQKTIDTMTAYFVQKAQEAMNASKQPASESKIIAAGGYKEFPTEYRQGPPAILWNPVPEQNKAPKSQMPATMTAQEAVALGNAAAKSQIVTNVNITTMDAAPPSLISNLSPVIDRIVVGALQRQGMK